MKNQSSKKALILVLMSVLSVALGASLFSVNQPALAEGELDTNVVTRLLGNGIPAIICGESDLTHNRPSPDNRIAKESDWRSNLNQRLWEIPKEIRFEITNITVGTGDHARVCVTLRPIAAENELPSKEEKITEKKAPIEKAENPAPPVFPEER